MGVEMHVEPPPSRWDFGDPRRFPVDEDLIGFGADLAPGTLLAGYRRGLFPMPSNEPPGHHSGQDRAHDPARDRAQDSRRVSGQEGGEPTAGRPRGRRTGSVPPAAESSRSTGCG